MADFSIGAPPWSQAFASCPLQTIVVAYNGDSAGGWCRTACENYCDARGIPRRNLVEVKTGISESEYDPTGVNVQQRSLSIWIEFLGPILTKLSEIGGNAILYGPCVQNNIAMQITTSYGWGTGDPADLAWPSLMDLGANVRYFSQYYNDGTVFVCGPSDSSQSYISAYGSLAIDRLTTMTHLDTVLGITVPYVTIPAPSAIKLQTLSQAQTASVWNGNRGCIPYGVIGWRARGPGAQLVNPPDAGTMATFQTRANTAMKARSKQANRAKQFFACIGASGGNNIEDWPRFIKMMKDWGLNVAYMYHENMPEYAPLPFSGQVFDFNAWKTGANTPINYFCQFGDFGDNEFSDPVPGDPEDGGSVALTGAVSVVIGPSSGWKMNQYALAPPGLAVAGALDHMHKYGGSIRTAFPQMWNLLRGMSLMEAAYFCAVAGDVGVAMNGAGRAVASGDPLYAPFGDSRFMINGKLT